MIHAYIGAGKGKTTASIGLAVRAKGAGKSVVFVMFDKGSETYSHNEIDSFKKLGIDYYVTGLERMKSDGKFRFGVTSEDKKEAQKGLKNAQKFLKEYDVVVLDEFLTALSCGLVAKIEAEALLDNVPESTELVLTGGCKEERILQKADLITEMLKHKHYFDKGVQARAGIEY